MGLLYIFIHIYLHMTEGYCHYIYETRIREAMQNKVRSFVLLHVKDLFCRYRKKTKTVGALYPPQEATSIFPIQLSITLHW